MSVNEKKEKDCICIQHIQAILYNGGAIAFGRSQHAHIQVST